MRCSRWEAYQWMPFKNKLFLTIFKNFLYIAGLNQYDQMSTSPLSPIAKKTIARATPNNGFVLDSPHPNVARALLRRGLVRSTNNDRVYRLTEHGKRERLAYIFETKQKRSQQS